MIPETVYDFECQRKNLRLLRFWTVGDRLLISYFRIGTPTGGLVVLGSTHWFRQTAGQEMTWEQSEAWEGGRSRAVVTIMRDTEQLRSVAAEMAEGIDYIRARVPFLRQYRFSFDLGTTMDVISSEDLVVRDDLGYV